jgi:calcineurin-like phosphoesterase family protein
MVYGGHVTHYWHKNITYGESVWANKETGCRRFNTTQEMSRHIVEQINKYVSQDDILFHLGDWSFGGIDNIWNFRKQIICQNIHFIFGNHDHHIIKNAVLPNCHEGDANVGDGYEVYDGAPHKWSVGENINAQDLFKSTQQYLEIFIDGRMLCLFHYPIEEWNDRHHQAWMLHGHSHGNAPLKDKRLDVGMDNVFKLFKEYRPLSWEEIQKIIKK